MATTPGGYTPEPRAYEDAIALSEAIDAFHAAVVDPLEILGFDLETTMGEVSFPAGFPPAAPAARGDPYYVDTNDKFQAAMLVRQFLVIRARGVRSVSWFTFKQGSWDGTTAGWTSNNWTTGLHNDIGVGVTAKNGAWRRPAWFALRRLVWLLGRCRRDGVTLLQNHQGLTLIRLTFRGSGLSVGPGGLPLSRAYRFGYVMWLDQFADDVNYHSGADLAPAPVADVYVDGSRVADTSGMDLLSLVPDVTHAALGLGADADGDGYDDATPNWSWTGWDRALDRLSSGLRLRKADPLTVIAPVCFLSNNILMSASF